MSTVSSNDNYIDPADVEVEADQFDSDIYDKEEEIDDAKTELEDEDAVDEQVALELKISELEDELAAIKEEGESIMSLRDDCSDYSRGSNLISEGIFTEYCEEFAYDCGDISRDSSMTMYVDWDRYAEDCKMDYTTITFEGTDFYVQG